MTNIEAYKIWAPDGVLWTEWAKPVMFANMTPANFPLDIPDIHWFDPFNHDMAVIVDLPGKKSVLESLALARKGYRPVPLYNGVCMENYSNMAVDSRGILWALYAGAAILSRLDLKSGAPPVFMLDSDRMKGSSKKPGMYDNRWCVFPQDMPSASFLLNHSIKRVIVRVQPDANFYENNIQPDLSHILYRYQEAGIKIQLIQSGNEIKNITISKPSQFKSLFYRFQALLGLSRNAVGGFGSIIPSLDDSDGYRGYGIG